MKEKGKGKGGYQKIMMGAHFAFEHVPEKGILMCCAS
jgi:hypothetical protein